MKPLRLPQLLLRGFWFIALLVGVFYLIERTQRTEERRALSRYSLMPDTAQEQKIYFVNLPDTLFFAEEALLLSEQGLRTRLEERYYYWTLRPQYFLPLLQRSYRWRKWIEDALNASNLPLDLLYLAAHRSQLNPNQLGRNAGLWGLDTTEARRYGLEVSNRRDERLDLFCSTSALADSLRRIQEKRSWNETLTHFCEEHLDCIAETLLFSELLSTPKRFGYHIPPQHRTKTLSYFRFQLSDSISIKALFSTPGLDRSTFRLYNPFLRNLKGYLPKGERIYLPLSADTLLLLKQMWPPSPRTS